MSPFTSKADHAGHQHASDITQDSTPTTVEHYAVEQPTTSAAALQLYHENMGIVQFLTSRHALDDTALEAIHEHSYALEAAVKAFHKLQVFSAEESKKLGHLAHELHEYSEEHDAEKTKKYAAKLHAAGEQLFR